MKEYNAMRRWNRGMRDAFFDSLYDLAVKDSRLMLLTSDTGAICHDNFKNKLSSQYINVGIAEQNMVGVAAGLAISGKIVYIYAIIPFVTMRCYEQIRIDLCYMNLAVTIVGIGAGFDYSTLGPTHHGTEDIALMRALPKMTIYSPADSLSASLFARLSYQHAGPKYIRLDREGLPLVYNSEENIKVLDGFSVLRDGRDVCIISTGRIIVTALEVAKKLSMELIKVSVIDLFRVKPINEDKILQEIRKVKYVVTLEEHFISGGIGSAVLEILAGRKNMPEFKAMGIPHQFSRCYGSREYLHRFNKIDVDSVAESIKKFMGICSKTKCRRL